jgi:hypothetical protein
MLSLTIVASLTGVALLWVWKQFSNRERIARARSQTRAQLYAMRLYADDPLLVLRAERQLLRWIGRYLAQMLRPTAVAVVPLLVLFVEMDSVYGHRPLARGETAVVTAQFAHGADLSGPAPTLEGRGILVETPGVRIPDRRQVCWRVRALPATSSSLLLHWRGPTITKPVQCGRTSAGGWGVAASLVASMPSIAISCPVADLNLFGLPIDWEIWFGAVSLITVLALRKA